MEEWERRKLCKGKEAIICGDGEALDLASTVQETGGVAAALERVLRRASEKPIITCSFSLQFWTTNIIFQL